MTTLTDALIFFANFKIKTPEQYVYISECIYTCCLCFLVVAKCINAINGTYSSVHHAVAVLINGMHSYFYLPETIWYKLHDILIYTACIWVY